MQLHDRTRERRATLAGPLDLAPGRAAARGGFALLELTIALILLTIGLVSMLQAGSRTQALSRENRERALAHNALRSASDRVLARSDAIVRAGDTDWAQGITGFYGPGGTLGNTFEVRGLNEVDEDVPVGSIRLIVDETTTDEALGVDAGMPRDLDGDGDMSSSDVSSFATKLPVVLEVRWRGFRGIRSLRHVVWITGV